MKETIRVWDPILRLFHWGLVFAFALAWLTSEDSQSIHEIAGYAVAGLIAFRLIWGLIGSPYSRFSQFIRGPSATLSYAADMMHGRERRYIGHNPAGAMMVVVLLVTLAVTSYTGWLMKDPARQGMLPGFTQVISSAVVEEESSEGSQYREGESNGAVKDMHEALAIFLLLLVAFHVVGVIYASIRHHENLAIAMVTAEKPAPDPDELSDRGDGGFVLCVEKCGEL